MTKVFNTYANRAAYSFSFAVIFVTAFKLISGNAICNLLFFIELLGLIVCIELIDYILSKFQFKSRILYLTVEFCMMYVFFFIFSYLGQWFTFSLLSQSIFSCVFFLFFLLIHLYDHIILQNEATRINSKLKKRKLN